ncbi:uncharacterized protein [Excalfactoria chinensis]|uniref:uncharacterized protein n=1 Tax=Excalfactoria chinensis TaxID=46218 RepID=UPI003B3B0348
MQKKKKDPPPGSTASARPAGACELSGNDLSELHRGAAAGDLAQVRRGLEEDDIDERDKAQRLSKDLTKYEDHDSTGEACAGATGGIPVPMTPQKARPAGFMLGAPALSREGMQRSPEQTLRTGHSHQAMDDISQGDSTRRSEKEGSNDSWHTSEEEELDFTAKKPQKRKLRMLMNVLQKFRNVGGGDYSRIENLKSQKKSLKQKEPTGANLKRGECRELLKQDVSDSSSLEEEEEVEEEEETQSNDIMEEEQRDVRYERLHDESCNKKSMLQKIFNRNQRPSSFMNDEDAEEGQRKEIRIKFQKESPKWNEEEEQEKEVTGRKLQTAVLGGECSESIIHVSSSAEKEMVKDASANYGRQDKYVLETTNLIENTAQEKQTDKAEISHQEALAENEESHSADKQLNLKPWEERYERMWVEEEKRELKTNFKSVMAELKQLFGEINESEETTSVVAEVSGDDFKEELKSFCVSSSVTESSNKSESKSEFGDVKLNVDLKEPNTEIVVPSLSVLPDHKNLSANVEIPERIPDEEGCTNYTDNSEVHLARAEETEENENGIGRNVEVSPEYSLRHCLKTNSLDDISNILPQIRPISTNDESTLGSVSKKKTGKDICLSDSVSRDCLIKNEEIGETGIENLFPHAQQPCGMLERNLDKELKQDVERFKSKVGMLQMVFLALEKEKKPQKRKLRMLMNVLQKFRNVGGGDCSRSENPKSQKKSLKQKEPTGANLKRGECRELLKQDVSNSSNIEEEKVVEKDEETQSNDIMEEEQRGKIELKEEVDQKLGYLSNVENEGDAQCGAGSVSSDSQKILKKTEEKIEESADTPVSFIDGRECSESIIHVSSSAEKEMVKDASANYGRQDKYVLETTNLIENTAQEKQTDKAEISHQEALAENEESHSADKQLNLKPWEERYERMWVEEEKRELKTNFKSVMAELKQLFGEINESEETTSVVAEVSGDDFKEEVKSFCVSSSVTESSNKLESKREFGDVKLNEDLKEPNTEIVVPSLGVLPDHKNLSANVEITERIPDEEGCTNYTDNSKEHLARAEETEENENGISRNVEVSPEYSLRHCLKTNSLDDISNILPQIRPISTNDESTLGSVSKKKTGKDICLSDSVSRDCLIKNEEIGETGIENLFPHAQQPCGMLERNLDKELKQDVERFKSKVGMLQMVFLALEKEKVQLQKEVEQEKRKQKHFKMQAVEKQEGLDKSDTPAGNITDQPVKEKLALRKNEKMIEEKHTKNSSSEERPKLLEMPVKGFSLKQEEEKRRRAETQYEETREQLKRKEDQYARETEEKQQLELHARNSETELITLRQLKKQKPQKRKLRMLKNVLQKFRNVGGGDCSRSENPKSQKKSLKQKEPTGANLNRGQCKDLLKQDVSNSSKLAEVEVVEEDEETQSNDIMEEEQRGKIELKEEVDQKLGYLSNVENEGDAQCGAGSVSSDSQKILKKTEEKIEESADTPVSFIDGRYESECLESIIHVSSSAEKEMVKDASANYGRQVSMQMDVTDDTDSTRSSDTTTDDAQLLTSSYKEAVLLLEQLSVDCTDPAILLKIQNILLEYEQRIDYERSRNTALWREVRKLESEKEESRLVAEQSEDLKSILSQQEMELKNDIQSLEFSLKREEEKRRRAETQYEETREQLKRKEDQYARETEEKQQLELRARNLETELITLRQLKKQVEEERDEAQRQLSQEKSARALQEGILSNHLLRLKELEEETRKTMRNNSELSSSIPN